MRSVTYTIPDRIYPLSSGFCKSIFKKKAVAWSGTINQIRKYYRKLGWIILSITWGVVVYKIVKCIDPRLKLGDSVLVTIGISFFVAMGILFTRLSIFVGPKSEDEDQEWMIE